MKRVSHFFLLFVFCTLSIFYELIGQQKDNKIIYLSTHEDVIQVYSMNSDGSNIKRITKSPERKYRPQVSPDGNNVLFTNEDSELIICDIDGGNERVISKNNESPASPTWSNDGKKILFASTRGGYEDSDGDPVRNIWIMDVDGNNAKQLTFSNYRNGEPHFSQDNTKIVFTSQRDKISFESSVDGKAYFIHRSQIYIMNSDGSDQKRLTALNHSIEYVDPSFSPDGNKILYIMNYTNAGENNDWSHIYIMDINGGHPTRLSGINDDHLAPFFNTSGDKIIYSALIDNSWKIMMMDTDGSNIVRISRDGYSNHNASFFNSNPNNISAQIKSEKINDNEFNLRASYGIDTHGVPLVMKNGQWVAEDGANITGELDITVDFDGEEIHFPTNIVGTKMIDDKQTYLCENGESFYLDGQTPKVIFDPDFKGKNENLNSLIENFRMNKSEKLVWEIWKIKSFKH